MESILLDQPLAAVAAGVFVVLWFAYEAGYAGGVRGRGNMEDGAADFGTIQGAVLGLLGLMLAFTYSFASGRHEARRDLVIREANVIATAWLRADFVPEPERSAMRGTLRSYAEARIVPREAEMTVALLEPIRRQAEALHAELWAATRRMVAGRNPTELDALVVAAVNEVIDVHSLRYRAAVDHVPLIVLALLLGSAILAMSLTGYGCGLSGRRNHIFVLILVALIVAVTAVTLDLDRPRRGFIRVSQQPLVELLRSMDATTGP